MKLRNLLLCLLLCASVASAHDLITKTDGSKLEAKVEEITDTFVRYRKASNPTGPIYTVPLTSVLTITYENGSIDNFNSKDSATSIPSENKSKNYTENMDNTNSGTMSDAELIKLNNSGLINVDVKDLYSSARKKRIIGWSGGGAIIAIGLVAAYFGSEQYGYTDDFWNIAGGSFVAATAWCVGFNLKANSLVRKAHEIEMYSSTILENEILRFGNRLLTAGVNMMGNQMLHSQGVGLSLKLNF